MTPDEKMPADPGEVLGTLTREIYNGAHPALTLKHATAIAENCVAALQSHDLSVYRARVVPAVPASEKHPDHSSWAGTLTHLESRYAKNATGPHDKDEYKRLAWDAFSLIRNMLAASPASETAPEPVAWQYRYRDAGGRWSDWRPAKTEDHARQYLRDRQREGATGLECRALYATQPPPAGSREAQADEYRDALEVIKEMCDVDGTTITDIWKVASEALK